MPQKGDPARSVARVDVTVGSFGSGRELGVRTVDALRADVGCDAAATVRKRLYRCVPSSS